MRKPKLSHSSRLRAARVLLTASALMALTGCTTLGSMMSPYSEKYSCKNSDHGQCIHPDKAYADAVAGRPSRSDPAVTNDRKLLRGGGDAANMDGGAARAGGKTMPGGNGAFGTYRDSVYRELQGLIDQPVTPMLKPSQAVRTLILPYADRQRPDRLYMPRYVYSILDKPQWVVGGYLVEPVAPSSQVPVLEQVRERPGDAADPLPARDATKPTVPPTALSAMPPPIPSATAPTDMPSVRPSARPMKEHHR
ncbi:conjugal transfer protein TraV [Caenibius tardaugens NBRC 16725]|uniref:Conjugal transfer protein TraV n=1 Tax=Caenibius tardaugens NBRC 16725 TaxID=1219035 RepID=U2Y8Q7_9SPHN|nr:TraV family lipoprotein [Caenibius tardaugens]AZI37790.1 conjugal transfer protein TraV [Caenibius tardaugens NBRC 16725]GAD49641.1 conjugal transfer protein TraV [Caenibius tardaugens NBRC 16725]